MAKVVFMGTPDFAVPTLEALIAHHDVIGVVTQPDRPAGRGGTYQASPIKQLAVKHAIPVFQPERIRRPDAIDTLRAWDAEVYIVAAFGQILPQALLDIPPHGSINVHASLLPRWRGAAPIQAAIRAGDAETGITIMKMDAGLDTGPMLSLTALPIMPDETGQSLHDMLSRLGASALMPTLHAYLDGQITPTPQDDSLSTFAPQIQKEDGRIQWTDDAQSIDRQVRAFTPWPGTFTFWGDKLLKILSGKPDNTHSAPAGVVTQGDGRVFIGTGSGVYVLDQVQLAGKKATSAADFVRGYPDFIGITLT